MHVILCYSHIRVFAPVDQSEAGFHGVWGQSDLEWGQGNLSQQWPMAIVDGGKKRVDDVEITHVSARKTGGWINWILNKVCNRFQME